MNESLGIEIITHKGKQILFWNYPDRIKQEELVTALNNQIAFLRKNQQFKCLITDISNIAISSDLVQVAKSNLDLFDGIQSVLLGVDGLKKILLWSYNQIAKKQVLTFDTKEEALEYLTKD